MKFMGGVDELRKHIATENMAKESGRGWFEMRE
jgi:hypothetical protein